MSEEYQGKKAIISIEERSLRHYVKIILKEKESLLLQEESYVAAFAQFKDQVYEYWILSLDEIQEGELYLLKSVLRKQAVGKVICVTSFQETRWRKELPESCSILTVPFASENLAQLVVA